MFTVWATRWLGEIQSGIRTLLLHKLRSSLTMLGMVFGVGSVIAMLAVGEGASAEALRQIRKLGSHNLIVSSIKPVDEATSDTVRIRMSIYGLKYADFERIKESIPHVSSASTPPRAPPPWIPSSPCATSNDPTRGQAQKPAVD